LLNIVFAEHGVIDLLADGEVSESQQLDVRMCCVVSLHPRQNSCKVTRHLTPICGHDAYHRLLLERIATILFAKRINGVEPFHLLPLLQEQSPKLSLIQHGPPVVWVPVDASPQFADMRRLGAPQPATDKG
jgi:hypothetical protein